MSIRPGVYIFDLNFLRFYLKREEYGNGGGIFPLYSTFVVVVVVVVVYGISNISSPWMPTGIHTIYFV